MEHVPPKVEHLMGFCLFNPFSVSFVISEKNVYLHKYIFRNQWETHKKNENDRVPLQKWNISRQKWNKKKTLNRGSHEQRFQTIVQIDCNIQNQFFV